MTELLEGEAVTIDAPGYIIVYVNNNSIGKDVYFDNIKIEHYAGTLLEENHYYPFGLTVSQAASGATAPENPYKYNTKELETTFGLQSYDYGARMYNSQIGRWNGLDPLADKYYGISPFAYVANNPVKYIDPDGREIVIAGNQAALAQNELQTSTNGNLNLYTKDNGSVGAIINFNSFTRMSESDTRLYQAIQDENITVNINATDSKTTSDGSLYVGGAFMGNTVDQGLFPGNFDNTVETKQDINPGVLKAMDDYYGKPGASTKHEALESYEGGVASKESGVSAGNSKVSPDLYKAAHEKASPQSGTVEQKLYDKDGNRTYNVNDAVKANWDVQEGEKPAITIQTLQ